MRTATLFALLISAGARADVPREDAALGRTGDAEAERLRGVWVVVEIQTRGRPPAGLADVPVGAHVEFAGGGMLLRETRDAPPERYGVRFDSSGVRKKIDVTPAIAGGGPLRGIYGGRGGLMWLCVAGDGCRRPEDLSDGERSDGSWVRFTLERSTP